MKGHAAVVFLAPVLACASAAALSGCATSPKETPDLAVNPVLYHDVAFATKAPGDLAAFVTPLADQRDPSTLQKGERGFPIVYDDDGGWSRPVREMVDEVLRRELAASGVFAGLEAKADANALVVKPTLVQFAGGTMEMPQGGRSLGEVGIRVQVWGPAAAGGKRTLLLDQVFGDRHVSSLAMLPPSPMFLQGRALRGAIGRVLAGLDGSNVARSGVPLDVALPEAPAAAPASAPAK